MEDYLTENIRKPIEPGLDSSTAFKERVSQAASKARRTITHCGHRAARQVKCAADYVRDHDAKAMAGDLKTLVRERPGESLAAATAAGFLIGRVLKKR